MAAKKKKSGGGSGAKNKAANAPVAASTPSINQAKRSTSTSLSFAVAGVGGDGLAAQLPDGYFIKRIPADGNCLFSAVDDQMTCLLESDPGALSSRTWSNFLASSSSSETSSSSPPPPPEGTTTTPPTIASMIAVTKAKLAASSKRGLPRGQAELRLAAALWIASHPTTFAPFLGDGDPSVVAFKYADRISRDAVWGGQCEQVALCQLLGVKLRIFQSGQAPWVIAPPMPEAEAGGEGEEEEGGAGGWKKPRKTAKKKRSTSGAGGGGGEGGGGAASAARSSSENGGTGEGENGDGDGDATPLPVINVSYHHGEHYNSVRRRPLDAREAAAAAAERHLRDRQAVERALAAMGDLEVGDDDDENGGKKKKKKKKQKQQYQEEEGEGAEQKPEASTEEKEEGEEAEATRGEIREEEEKDKEKDKQQSASSSSSSSSLRKNDPCGCGSQLRYKSCCRPRDRARVRAVALAEAAGVDVSELARKLGDGGDEIAARLEKELVV